jgi:hypothetical protein
MEDALQEEDYHLEGAIFDQYRNNPEAGEPDERPTLKPSNKEVRFDEDENEYQDGPA